MNILKQLKGVHWTAIILATLGFAIAQLAKAPQLADEAALLNWLGGVLATGGVGTALGAHKVGFEAATDSKAGQRGYTKVSSMIWLAVLALACVVVACGGALLAGCTPAESAKWSQVEAVVLADVNAGKNLQQIESDVAGIVIGADAPLVLTIVDDALTVLEDLGAFSLADMPHEADVHQQAKLARTAAMKALK